MAQEKKHVEVHVTFLKIGEINTLKETYDADVLLRSKWREPRLDNMQDRFHPLYPSNVNQSRQGDDVKKSQRPLSQSLETTDPTHVIGQTEINLEDYWNPEIYIDNVVGEPKRVSSIHTEYDANGKAYIVERRRVKGAFMETMELFEFPFDVQDLSVVVMSEKPTTEVELVECPEEIHKIYKQSFIDEQEFYLYKYIESEKKELAKDRADPSIMRSALTVQCRAARRPAYFLWNSFSVTFLICCLAFVTFAVDADKPQNRLQLSFTLVLTAVAFKFVVNQSLPKISYLTYLDRYILATMICLAAVAFWHGFVTVFLNRDQADKLEYVRTNHVDKIAIVIIGGLWIIYNLQYWLRIYAIDRYVLATMIILATVCFWHGIVTVIPSDIKDGYYVDLVALLATAGGGIIYNLQFIIRIYAVDRYILAALVCLGSVCGWHGTITVIKDDRNKQIADRAALGICACIYILYNIIFITRIVLRPYRKRRMMQSLEKNYIVLVRKQAEIRKSRKESQGQDALKKVTTHM